MILLDTNVLSTFGKINRLNLLFDIFKEDICISSNVLDEIKNADEQGYSFADKVISLIDEGKIMVISSSQEERQYMVTLPLSFGSGERDSVAIAKKRRGVFVTNEKRLWNFCETEEIDFLTLNNLLKLLWKDKILTKEEVRKLIDEIEEKDNIVIVSKDEIFAD